MNGKKSKTITRTVTQYTHYFGKVDDDFQLQIVDQSTMTEKMGERKAAAYAKANYGEGVNLVKVTSKEVCYEMDLDIFIQNARVVGE